jgi:hypothetical protein
MDFKSALSGIFFLSGVKWFDSVKLNSTLTKIITIYFAGGLSLYVDDAAHDIATKIAKKPFNGNDRGNSLLFQEFIQSWVGYELVKVLKCLVYSQK